MADKITSTEIAKMVHNIDRNADLPGDVKDQVRSFQDKLKRVSSFLNYSFDTDEPEVAALRMEIREVANNAQNTMFKLNRIKWAPGRKAKLRDLICFSGCETDLRGEAVASMERLTQKLTVIAKEDKFNPRRGLSSSGLPVEEPDAVGLDGEAEDVVHKLKQGEPEQLVVSIFGLAGIGKTTLARKVYNHKDVKDHFKFRAWVRVPQDYKAADLLMCLLYQISDEREDREVLDKKNQEPNEVLYKRLSKERYLIVMDDLWEKQVWDEVKSSFPDVSNGSRILLTSRLEEVALHASPATPPHKLDFLCPPDRWKLLRKTALGGESCPEELENIGVQIANKCEGLPLAIVILGRILAKQDKKVESWSRIRDEADKYLMISEKGKQGRGLMNLPQHLEKCFLYLGMFPKGEIPVRQLIQLWIAEGIAEERVDQKPEEVGEKYLKELEGLSLIQAVARRTDGGVKTCRILNLFHDLCMLGAEQSNFFLVQLINNSNLNRDGQPSMLAIHSDSPAEALTLRSGTKSEQLHSFHCYVSDSLDNLASRRLWRTLYNNFSSLKVLNIGSVKVERIPKGVKKLLQLKYLRVNAPNLSRVPRSIGSLLELQTLDLRESHVHFIPDGLWKMKSLRHLYFRSSASFRDPGGSQEWKVLSSLLTLSGVHADGALKRLMVKGRFPNVTKLSIRSLKKKDSLNFLESLDHLYHLQSLKIVNDSELPDPHAFPLTLTKITLRETRLPSSSMQILEKLPHLQILKLLKDSIRGSEITCSGSGFLQLKVMHLVELEVERWIVKANAMQSVEHLVIRDCAELKDVRVFQPTNTLREKLEALQQSQLKCTIQIDPVDA